VSATQHYRAMFTPSEAFPEPKVILATSAICADTDERAEELATSMGLAWARMRSGKPAPLPSPEEAKNYHYSFAEQTLVREYRTRQTVGRPSVVRERLLKLVEETGADELMLNTIVYGYENRARSY